MADTTPTLREAAQQALEALEKLLLAVDIDTVRMLVDDEPFDAARTTLDALRAALAKQAAEQGVPVAVPASIVAGAIFDFAGFLTTHKCVIKVGSTANASPVVERIKEWAGLRGLPIDDADVLSWQKNTAPPAPAPTWPEWAEQILKIVREYSGYDGYDDEDGVDLPEEVREALEELTTQIERLEAKAPAPARQEWQPIETAPRDGTPLLAYRERDGKIAVAYRVPRNDFEVWYFGGACAAERFFPGHRPSHWQPLPAAPITAAPAEGGAAALTQPEGGA